MTRRFASALLLTLIVGLPLAAQLPSPWEYLGYEAGERFAFIEPYSRGGLLAPPLVIEEETLFRALPKVRPFPGPRSTP